MSCGPNIQNGSVYTQTNLQVQYGTTAKTAMGRHAGAGLHLEINREEVRDAPERELGNDS